MILARNPHPNMRGVFMNPEDELELQKRRLIDNVRESVEKELLLARNYGSFDNEWSIPAIEIKISKH